MSNGKPTPDMAPVRAVFKVKASSTLPPGKSSWEVVLDDPTGLRDPMDVAKAALVYTNLGYGLIGAAMTKLGWEYSKLVTGEQTRPEFDAKMKSVANALATIE